MKKKKHEACGMSENAGATKLARIRGTRGTILSDKPMWSYLANGSEGQRWWPQKTSQEMTRNYSETDRERYSLVNSWDGNGTSKFANWLSQKQMELAVNPGLIAKGYSETCVFHRCVVKCFLACNKWHCIFFTVIPQSSGSFTKWTLRKFQSSEFEVTVAPRALH